MIAELNAAGGCHKEIEGMQMVWGPGCSQIPRGQVRVALPDDRSQLAILLTASDPLGVTWSLCTS